MLSDDAVEIVESDYGKNYVKLLHVRREGDRHFIKEIEVNSALTLDDHNDYVYANNAKIVATDTQKNTVYILAKMRGISSIEQFALELSQHFLTKYPQVIATKIHIKEAPWNRMTKDGKEHVHAFVSAAECTRYCDVEQKKNGVPRITAGFQDLKIIKTTKSSFTNFYKDEFRSLPDMDDRIFCTVVKTQWWYNTHHGIDFDQTWNTVKSIVLDTFAGPPDTGDHSPSVQNTLYAAEKTVLSKLPQVEKIEIILPNVHAYQFDFSKFPAFGITENNEVFQPTDKPSGNIRGCLQRKQKSRL